MERKRQVDKHTQHTQRERERARENAKWRERDRLTNTHRERG
jgi:hypothetical protein